MCDTRHSVQNLVDHSTQDTHTKNKKNISEKRNFLESADRNHWMIPARTWCNYTGKKESFMTKVKMLKTANHQRQNISKWEHVSFPADGEMYLGSDATLLHNQSLRYCYKVKFAWNVWGIWRNLVFKGSHWLINTDLYMYHQWHLSWNGPIARRQQNCDIIQDLNKGSWGHNTMVFHL